MRLHVLAVLASVVLVMAGTVAFSQQDIPEWIKTTAGWWAQGEVDDSSFISSIQWLINEGHITLESNDLMRVEGKFTIWQPTDWEWQKPIYDQTLMSEHNSMLMRDTMHEDISTQISISVMPMRGESIEEHREWGFELVNEFLGDSFSHDSSSTATVAGKPGYVDEYSVKILQLHIRGISYSFEHESNIYEIKYETDAKNYQKYLPVFERAYQTFQLE